LFAEFSYGKLRFFELAAQTATYQKTMDEREQTNPGGRVYPQFSIGETFEQAFPSIKHVRVEITESNYNYPGGPKTFTKTEADLSATLKCHYRDCLDGGMYIGDMLQQMVANHTEDLKKSACCVGHGKPHGRARTPGDVCKTFFEIDVHIEYK
jgi:hypothetical protein